MNNISWLIESQPITNLGVTYSEFWCGYRDDDAVSAWSSLASDAVRFVRKQDAESALRVLQHDMRVIGGREYDNVSVAEHAWVDQTTVAYYWTGRYAHLYCEKLSGRIMGMIKSDYSIDSIYTGEVGGKVIGQFIGDRFAKLAVERTVAPSARAIPTRPTPPPGRIIKEHNDAPVP